MRRLAALLLLVGLTCAGCAAPQAGVLMEAAATGSALPPAALPPAALPPAPLPPAAQVANVPFFAQSEHQCGPAALAMLLAFAGRPADVERLSRQVYLPAREGSLQAELQGALRRAALLPYPTEPALAALLAEVASGRPVLVLQNLGLPVAPLWHYAVLIGYDLQAGTVTLHSGVERAMTLSIHVFERTWSRAGSWAITAANPARPPASAQPLTWLRAAAALERVQPTAGRAAYLAAVERWPGLPQGWFALGNQALADNQLASAEQALRHAVALDPAFADAWNNLAVTLLRQQRRPEALEAIGRAQALIPDRRAEYDATRRDIEASRP